MGKDTGFGRAEEGCGAGRDGPGSGPEGVGSPGTSRRTIVRELRGIPFFLLREYLQDLGGTAIGEDRVQGPGWEATLKRMEPFRIGSLSVGQNQLILEIEEELADEFMAHLELKTLRAGA